MDRSARGFYFAPGPVNLPESVLFQAKGALEGLGGGVGILGLSHRSDIFDEIIAKTEANFRKLGEISNDYAVLFLQGGATQQFWQIPSVFAHGAKIQVIHTGFWTAAAMRDARPYCDLHVAYDGEPEKFQRIPESQNIVCDTDSRYAYYCSNNSFCGTQWVHPPELDLPLVGDLSSDIFSRPLAMKGHAAVFASAQKNLGIAGLCVVVLEREFMRRYQRSDLPALHNYILLDEQRSMLNTPPIFSIYVMGLMLEWMQSEGGLGAIFEKNKLKAKCIRDAIDDCADFYQHAGHEANRSICNVCFRCKTAQLDSLFVQEAAAEGLHALAGHRSCGGLRASIFNAVPLEACESLASFVREFARRARL